MESPPVILVNRVSSNAVQRGAVMLYPTADFKWGSSFQLFCHALLPALIGGRIVIRSNILHREIVAVKPGAAGLVIVVTIAYAIFVGFVKSRMKADCLI